MHLCGWIAVGQSPRPSKLPAKSGRSMVREARRFVLAVVLSVASIPIIADPAVGWIGFLPAMVCLSLGGFVSWSCDRAGCGPLSAPR